MSLYFREIHMERYLRFIAGVFILISLALSRLHSEYWLIFTLIVGLNLLQSGLTDWCPMMVILRRLGIRGCRE